MLAKLPSNLKIVRITPKLFFVMILFLLSPSLIAQHKQSPADYQASWQQFNIYDQYPYSIMYYYGISVSDALIRLLTGSLHRYPEHIHSVELSYALGEENNIRRFFSSLVDSVALASNFTFRAGANESLIKEIDPYLAFRWVSFPWDHYLTTTFAIGEGVSYVTAVPALEKKYHHHHNKRLLNYLMLEATFAEPRYPRLQCVIRIHHRSGAYGLYGAGNTGSNVIGLGIRYLFK